MNLNRVRCLHTTKVIQVKVFHCTFREKEEKKNDIFNYAKLSRRSN